MKKIIKLLQDKLFLAIFKSVVSLLFGAIFFLCWFFTHERTYSTISTGFFVPGAILLVIGFLSFVNHLGGWDFISYASLTTIQYLKKNPEDLIAYKEYKNEKREFEGPIYLPYLIFGLIFFVLAIVFYVLFKKSI